MLPVHWFLALVACCRPLIGSCSRPKDHKSAHRTGPHNGQLRLEHAGSLHKNYSALLARNDRSSFREKARAQFIAHTKKRDKLNSSYLTEDESVRRAELLQRSLKKKYPPCERCLSVEEGAVTLDFEVEPGVTLVTTPAILVQRGGFKLDEDVGGSWPSVSSFFEVGIEGHGLPHRRSMPRFNTFLQSPIGQMEITSTALRPRAVLNGFLPDLKDYLHQLGGDHRTAEVLPKSSGIEYTGGWKNLHVHRNPAKYSPLHWTVGLELKKVPLLLSTTFPNIGEKLKQMCEGDDQRCVPEYQGVVALAASTVQEATKCKQVCGHPKRCQKPWLVRTHFGDMVQHLRKVVGDDVVQRLPEDVLNIAGLEPGGSDALFRRPREYWSLLEMAEYSGLVPSRMPLNLKFQNTEGLEMQPMPQNQEELLSMAQRMKDSMPIVEKRLASAPCDLNQGEEDESHLKIVTAQDWLQGLLQGQDSMSDRDSPISQAGLSKVVWKSMGAWNMKDDGRVYLECRRTLLCLPQGAADKNLVLEEIERVANWMQSFERTGGTGGAGANSTAVDEE